MFLDFFKKGKNWEIIILSLIIGLAFVVRFWNFGPWLYFEADQARDANIVKAAMENGPGYLPLLGPRAAGTFLRLGPIEYYFQYLSAVLFDSFEPFVLAYPALLFSLLSIGVFYYFLKHFFTRTISLSVAAVFAFSFILIQYSRFAWNPNGIPFWGLLFMLSCYKAYAEDNRKKAGLWLLGAAASYGVVSQMHFLALVGFPLAAVAFWLLYFPRKIKIYFWAGALALVMLFYLPMFFSEVSTGGDNFRQFKYALTAKTGSGEETLWIKAKNDCRQVAIAFSMFSTSFGHKDSRVALYFGVMLIFGGLGYGLWLARKDRKKRALFWLTCCWLAVFLFLYIKTSTSLKPRFFFPIAPLPFLFLSYGMDFFAAFNRRKKVGHFLVVALSLIFIWANLDAVRQWYAFLATADEKSISRKMSLKQDSGITLEGLTAVADYMAEESKKNQKRVCYDGIQEYKRTMEYILEVRYPELGRARISNGMSEKDKRSCQFFSFAQKKTGQAKVSSRHSQYFEKKPVYQAGNLAVWSLTAREEFFSGQELPSIKEAAEKEEATEASDSDNAEEIAADKAEENLETETLEAPTPQPTENPEKTVPAPPRRVERVYWKDVF